MRAFRRILLASVMPLWLMALAVHAQQLQSNPASSTNLLDLSIEQLMDVRVDTVYGASKYEQKINQAPSSISVITSDEIKKFGYRTLADVLRGARGMYVTYDRNYSNFGIRGFGRPGDFNTRLLLLVDGHRMNDSLYDSALVGPEATVDVDLIDRVELIRGPSSSIYGNNAFFGVINVITRRGGQISGGEASVEAGSFDTYKGRFTVGQQLTNGVELLFSGTFSDSKGQDRLFYREFNNRRNNFGVAENADGESFYNLFSRVSYADFSLSAAYSVRNKDVPTASFGTVFNDGREKTTDERIYVDLKYEHAFSDDRKLLARVYYDRYNYRARYPYNFAGPSDPPFLVVTHDDNYGEGVGAEAQLTQKILDRHTAILGAEVRDDLNLYQGNYTRHPKTFGFASNNSRSSVGVYGEGELVICTNLLMNAGIRYDHYSDFGDTVNPRVALIYSPWEKSTFKLLYGRAYRAPNAYEQHLEAPGFNKANPNLDPETISTYELVYEQALSKNLRLSLSGYYYDIDRLISQTLDRDGLYIFRNISSVSAKGVEVELEGHYAHGLMARASYTLQRAENEETGDEINNSPRHLGKFNLSIPLYQEKIYAGIEVQYMSGLKTIAGDRTSDFAVANLTLFSRELIKNLEASASIYNLFDTKYAYPGSTGHVQDSIPQDGRTFRIKLTYKF